MPDSETKSKRARDPVVCTLKVVGHLLTMQIRKPKAGLCSQANHCCLWQNINDKPYTQT